MSVDANTKRILQLVAQDADEAQWAQVSEVVWPLVEKLPSELIERQRDEPNGGRCRLTEAGKIVLRYVY